MLLLLLSNARTPRHWYCTGALVLLTDPAPAFCACVGVCFLWKVKSGQCETLTLNDTKRNDARAEYFLLLKVGAEAIFIGFRLDCRLKMRRLIFGCKDRNPLDWRKEKPERENPVHKTTRFSRDALFLHCCNKLHTFSTTLYHWALAAAAAAGRTYTHSVASASVSLFGFSALTNYRQIQIILFRITRSRHNRKHWTKCRWQGGKIAELRSTNDTHKKGRWKKTSLWAGPVRIRIQVSGK